MEARKGGEEGIAEPKPILTDGYINIILSLYVSQQGDVFSFRLSKAHGHATRMRRREMRPSSPSCHSHDGVRAMEIMPSAFVLLLVLVVIVIVIPSTHTHDLRRFRRFFLNRFCLFFVCL